MPDAGAICPNPQRISEATSERTPGSFLYKGSIVRVWRATPFQQEEKKRENEAESAHKIVTDLPDGWKEVRREDGSCADKGYEYGKCCGRSAHRCIRGAW